MGTLIPGQRDFGLMAIGFVFITNVHRCGGQFFMSRRTEGFDGAGSFELQSPEGKVNPVAAKI